ncbi:MAG: hypothetical protein AMS18_12300 [Gemmatimonas sp. SG8_17]|nr:MAG: hypothetical protein AMS18_12300 [Gemmatimonas sp. SG8_17]
MITAIGIVVLIAGLIAWLGQSLAFFAPSWAVRFGVLEPEEDIDSTLRVIEARAEDLTDILLTWTLPLSGLLMVLKHPLWPYLALVGGGVFLYIAGLITLSRVFLKREGKKVGLPASERAAYLFGGIWAFPHWQ